MAGRQAKRARGAARSAGSGSRTSRLTRADRMSSDTGSSATVRRVGTLCRAAASAPGPATHVEAESGVEECGRARSRPLTPCAVVSRDRRSLQSPRRAGAWIRRARESREARARCRRRGRVAHPLARRRRLGTAPGGSLTPCRMPVLASHSRGACRRRRRRRVLRRRAVVSETGPTLGPTLAYR
jgi:hypothetical protein